MSIVAGSPAASADVAAISALTLAKPLVRLIASGTQNLTLNTITAITFTGSEEIDTHGFHNPASNSSRVTPSIPGYYRISGFFYITNANPNPGIETFIGKNGTAQAGGMRMENNTVAFARGIYATAIQQANGSSDYFELLALQNITSGSTQPTNQSGRFSCVLELEFLRSL